MPSRLPLLLVAGLLALSNAQPGVTCTNNPGVSTIDETILNFKAATTLVSNLGNRGPDGNKCQVESSRSPFTCKTGAEFLAEGFRTNMDEVPPVIQFGPVGTDYLGNVLDLRISVAGSGISTTTTPVSEFFAEG
jgi:hypothetical protein